MPRPSAPSSRSIYPRNMANKRGSTSRTFVKDKRPNRPSGTMRTKPAKKEKKIEDPFKDEFIIVGRCSRDLRFTIPDVPANRDLLRFLNTRAHDMMRDVIRELHTVSKIKVCHFLSWTNPLSLSQRFMIAFGCMKSFFCNSSGDKFYFSYLEHNDSFSPIAHLLQVYRIVLTWFQPFH